MPQCPPHEVVAQRSRRNVAAPPGHLRGDLCLLSRGERPGRTGVHHGLERARTIGGHDVHGPADGTARGGHLGHGRARLRRDTLHHVQGVLALAFGLAQAVGGDVRPLEYGSIQLGLAVRAGAGNDAALNAEGGGVATCITGLSFLLVSVTFPTGRRRDLQLRQSCRGPRRRPRGRGQARPNAFREG